MADHSVFSTAGRTPSAQMDADLSTLHAPEAAAEVVDEGCRRVRERGQIDIVRSANLDKADKRMAIRRMADIGAKLPPFVRTRHFS
jgi:acetyl-CoA acetyltransferase